MSSLSEYLDFLWEDTRAFVNLSLKADDGSWSRSFAEWPRQRTSVESFISAKTAAGFEVFVSPSMWKSKPPPGQQYGKELFLGSHVLWAEFDGNAPDSWNASYNSPILQGSISGEAITRPPGPGGSAADSGPARGTSGDSPEPGIGQDSSQESKIVAPSWINQTSSSQHQHVYWKLGQLLTDPDLLENLNRTIASELGADNCWDATRVLRPPGTTNYGIGKPDRKGTTYPVRVEEANSRRYPIQEFKQTYDFRPLVRASMDDIPDIREVLAKHTWDADFYKAFSEEPPYKKRSDVLQFLAYSAAESGFTNEEIYIVLRDADDRWQKYTGRLDRDKWLIDHVDRARTKYPFGVETLTFEGLLGTKRTKGTEDLNPASEVPDKLLFTLPEIWEVNVKIDWLLKGLLPRAGYGILAGPNGIGKSQMGIRLCEAITEGTKFLGKWKCKIPNAKAMFLSLEMEPAELQEFYRTMNEYEPIFPTSGERYLTAPIGEAIALDKPEGLKFLSGILDEHRPDLLVIDSLSVAMDGNFREDKATLEFNKVMKHLRKKFGVAIVVIHHNRKGQDKKFRYNELDDLFGSRFLAQDSSFVLMLDKPKTLGGDTISVNPAKIRFDKTGGEIHVDHVNMNFTNMVEMDDMQLPMALETPKRTVPTSTARSTAGTTETRLPEPKDSKNDDLK